MIKCDFHIHTQATQWDAPFEFDIDELENFVKGNKLDAIAITNHNVFIKSNFDDIKLRMQNNNVVVFPGIEVSVKSGHIIVISDISDEEKINECSSKLAKYHLDKEGSISIEDFNNIFCGNNFLIIPHYKKDPPLSIEEIKSIKDRVYVGEVCNAKKFYFTKNHIEIDKIVPVLFSDHRAYIKSPEETRYTYIDANTVSFNEIILKLQSIKNVFLAEKNNYGFDVLSGNIIASQGINVLLGKRSSGKTFTLDSINNSSLPNSKNILYIKQFAISKECDDTSFEKFNDRCLEGPKSSSLKELQNLLSAMEELDCQSNYEHLANYLTSLKKNADENVKDEFSKTILFNENIFDLPSTDEIQKLIKSIEELINSYEKYSAIFTKFIVKENLINLRNGFLLEERKTKIDLKKKEYINLIINSIKKRLSVKSGATIISDINFESIYRIRCFRNKFNYLVNNLKESIVECQTIAGKFNKRILFRPYKNWSEFKTNTIFKNCKEQFEEYITNIKTRDPFQFCLYLSFEDKKSGAKHDLASCFLTFEQTITSQTGNELSGGERAEYILLEKLSMYQNYDIVLIDEMESSFDNPFLNITIDDLIHNMAKSCIVFISTHNNNIGVSLKPDNYIYHSVKIDENGKKTFKQYYGKGPSLSSKDGKSISLKEVLLETMEASDEAYKEREKIYEIS